MPELLPPRAGSRPALAAKLSVADLARVRQALALLSEGPSTPSERMAGQGDGLVPFSGADGQQAGGATADADDEADTYPMPVILSGATPPQRSGPVEAARGPFEPARPGGQPSQPEPAPPAATVPADNLPEAAAAKLDQIKDLLLTAEAIGEQNLDQHFEQVSQRQRELIREFFDEAAPGRDTSA